MGLTAVIHSHASSTDSFEDAVVNQQCPNRWCLSSRAPAGIPTDKPIGVASPTHFKLGPTNTLIEDNFAYKGPVW